MNEKEFKSDGIHTNLLIVLALLSGCCSLAYEVLYVRVLTSILGDMFYVHAALLSTFLVGIGLGAKVAHRWLRWLWAFEILTGLYALGLPFATKWFSQQSLMIQVTSSPMLTILATVGILSIPSLLIGFSIPLFSAYLKARTIHRLAFRAVYKIYNLGAFLSILAVELFFIRSFGVSLSLSIIGAINLINGIVLVLVGMAPKDRPVQSARTFPRHVIIALALASLVSALFQMFFLKLSYLVFHPHRENFAVAISISLLGLFLGTWLVSKIKIRFETLLVLLSVFIGIIYVSYLPILRTYQKTIPWAQHSESLIFAHKFLFGCLFALAPMILFGALIPALMRTEKEVAGESGHLLWISSLANAAGYLLYVLAAHTLLPNDLLLALIGITALFAGFLAVRFRWLLYQRVLAVCALILLAVLIFQWKERNFYLAHWVNFEYYERKLYPDDEVITFKSGAESATLVRSQGIDWISYNGHPSIYVQKKGVTNFAEIMVGVIPALSAPRLEQALVLGFGTGITAGSAARVFQSTDVVEINNAFYKMMPSLKVANMEIEYNPSAKLHLSDGRAFLVGKKDFYDAIINTVPAPTYFSASKIYTVEFYERVARALKPDGVFSLWLSWEDMSEEGIPTMLSALHHSFRYCDLRLMKGAYYIATCSNEPIHTRRFSELPVEQNLVEELQRSLIGFDLDEFFEDMRVSKNLFDHFTPNVPLDNTDDHPVLEFMAIRDYQMGKRGNDPFLMQQQLLNINPVRRDDFTDPNRFVRRAAFFYLFSRDYFEKNFLPILRKNPEKMILFFAWNGEYLAALNKPAEAIKFFNEALKLALSSEKQELAEKVQDQIKLYQSEE
jgi:predicted membrane-bound spermidine synthase